MLENTETVSMNSKEVYSEDGISKIFLLKYTHDPPDHNSSSGGKHSNGHIMSWRGEKLTYNDDVYGVPFYCSSIIVLCVYKCMS